MDKKRTGVIGAGPAGCMAAWKLQGKGREVVLFEKKALPGGRTWVWRQDGLQLDTAAGFFTNFYPLLRNMAGPHCFRV